MSEPTTAAGDALLTDLIQDHEAPSYHVIERVRRGILAIEAEARVAGAAEVAGLDAAVAAIKAVRARWLEKPRTPVVEGVDIGIELALSLLLIERDRARWDADNGRLTGGVR